MSTSTAGAATTANVVFYYHMIGGLNSPTATQSESFSQNKMRYAATLSRLLVTLYANSVAANTPYTLRKNGVSQAITVTIGSSATGQFEDLIHTVSFVNGDLMNFQISPGATTGTMQNYHHSMTQDNSSSTTTVIKMAYAGTFPNSTLTGASTTYYLPLSGQFTSGNGANTVEAQAQCLINYASSVSNLMGYVSSNSRTTTTTVNLRKNAANATQTFSISSTTTGFFEDTTHTDTLVATDKINYSVVNGTDTNAINWQQLSVEYTYSSYPGVTPWISSDMNSTDTVATSTTKWSCLGNGREFWTTNAETQEQVKTEEVFTLQKLYSYVQTNSITAASTLTLRSGAANTVITTSITASTTGAFQDTTHTLTTTSTSQLNYQLTTGTTGTSIYIANVSLFASFDYPSQSVSISESAISTSVTSLTRKAVRKAMTETVSFGTFSTKVKAIRKISEPAISFGTFSIKVKTVRAVSEPAKSISDTFSSAIRKYTRTISEPSVTFGTFSVKLKVIRKITSPSFTISDTSPVKKAYKTITEPAKSIATTSFVLKVIRKITSPNFTISDTSPVKKAYKTITEPAKSISTTFNFKVIRKVSEPVISVSGIISTRFYKAIRTISETAITVTAPMVLKVTRVISEPAKSITDIVSVRSPKHSSISEPAISANTSTITKKVTHFISEPAKSITTSLSMVIKRFISEPIISSSTSILNKKMISSISEPAKSISDSLTRFKKAVRSSVSEPPKTISDSLSRTNRFARPINEQAINNILDSFTAVHVVKRISISDPHITTTDTTPTRQARYSRTIGEVPFIHVNDIMNTTKVLFMEQHTFKTGRYFRHNRPDDEQFAVNLHQK